MKPTNGLFNRLFSDSDEVTEEVVDYYEKNPDELDLIINKEFFYVNFLGLFFFLGLGITVGARIASFFFGGYLGDFVNNVVLDVISELGIAIFGGAVVAYLIEFLNKRQYQQNLLFRKKVKQRIAERHKKN